MMKRLAAVIIGAIVAFGQAAPLFAAASCAPEAQTCCCGHDLSQAADPCGGQCAMDACGDAEATDTAPEASVAGSQNLLLAMPVSAVNAEALLRLSSLQASDYHSPAPPGKTYLFHRNLRR